MPSSPPSSFARRHGLALGLAALVVPAAVRGQPAEVLQLPAGTADDAQAGGSVQFVGTATVVLRLGGITLLTDPNFLHRGQRAQLGYGLSSPRLTEPAFPIESLPPVDAVLLSHYHGDHFDEVAEAKLPRTLPILTTAHAARQLRERGFAAARALDTWQALELRKGVERVRITAMPGRHGPAGVALALPPVMGSLVEWLAPGGEPAYRIYISGDTLVFDALKEIPRRYPGLDLALLHLGGTRIFGVLVTMDAEQGVQALKLLQPARAVPIHYDDYAVFRSSLEDFLRAAEAAGWRDKVQVLARGERLAFSPRAVR